MQKTILVVEDDEMSIKLLGQILEAVGYEWVSAPDGLIALTLARDIHPDLILLDVQLPGKSGLEVAREIRSDISLHRIPIIAVTAFAMVGDKEKILAAGCDDYVSKPIEVANLVSLIKNTIGNPTS